MTRRLLTTILIVVFAVGACGAIALAALLVPARVLDALRPAPPTGIVRIQPGVHRLVTLPAGRLDLTLTGGIESNQTAHVEVTAPDGSVSRFDLAAGEQNEVAGATIKSVRTWRSLDPRFDALYARIDLATSNGERVRLANRSLESAPRGGVSQLEEQMPWLVPSTAAASWPYTGWRDTSQLPLWNRSGSLDVATDINQGQLGDCWFLSSLEAVALANPGLVQRGLQANGNGTYTVTFHIGGRAVPVTVTDELPYQTDYLYASPGSDGAKWAPIYEKALAQLVDGYANAGRDQNTPVLSGIAMAIGQYEDNFAALEGISMLSGSRVQELPPVAFRPQDARLPAQGYATVAWTNPWRANNADLIPGLVPGGHSFVVAGLGSDSLTLLNPWGRQGRDPETITLTRDQFTSNFELVWTAKVR